MRDDRAPGFAARGFFAVFKSDRVRDRDRAIRAKLQNAHLALREGFIAHELAREWKRLADRFGSQFDACNNDRRAPRDFGKQRRLDAIIFADRNVLLAQNIFGRDGSRVEYAPLAVRDQHDAFDGGRARG